MNQPKTAAPSQKDSFWTSTSLEELARRQGVTPVEDLDELAALWPGDEDPDDLLNFILRERADRRSGSETEADRK